VSFGRRLGRLEVRRTRCPECGLTPSEHGRPVAVYEEHPDKGFQGDTSERCGRCGRFLYTVLNVVYDSPEVEEGGGGLT
jgi:ribosomal protein L37E